MWPRSQSMRLDNKLMCLMRWWITWAKLFQLGAVVVLWNIVCHHRIFHSIGVLFGPPARFHQACQSWARLFNCPHFSPFPSRLLRGSSNDIPFLKCGIYWNPLSIVHTKYLCHLCRDYATFIYLKQPLAWPSLSSSRLENMWKIWLDGWCIVVMTVLPVDWT